MEAPSRPTFIKDLRLYILMCVSAVILLILQLDEETGLADTQYRINRLERRIKTTKALLVTNRETMLPVQEKVLNPHLLAEKSLRTVVKEATEEVGIAGSLEAINPTEDRKKGIIKARVTLRAIPLRKLVAFLVHLKNLSAGIKDVDATMRMVGYNQDRWRVDLTLMAPLGKPAPKPKTGGERKKNATKPI